MTEDSEKIIGRIIQGDIPLSRRPFAAAAPGVTEALFLETIKQMMASGRIRKFCAILRHEKAGFSNNAMAIWAVPAERVDEVGTFFAGYPEITHCYERTPPFLGRYNLFTMVHLSPAQNRSFFSKLASEAGVSDYEILESVEEFKKTSMEYYR